MLNPVDCINQPIELQMNVVFGKAGSMQLIKGKVTKINAKTVTIEHDEYNNGPYSTITESRRAFQDVVVIPSPEDAKDLFSDTVKSNENIRIPHQ